MMKGILTATVMALLTFGEPEIERSGDCFRIGLEMDLSGIEAKGNRAVLLTPRLVSGTDSLDLPSVGIYSRQAYYFYVRNRRGIQGRRTPSGAAPGGRGEESFRERERPDALDYRRVIKLPDWAGRDTVELHLIRSEFGCCNALTDRKDTLLAIWSEPAPAVEAAVLQPAAGRECRRLRVVHGSARIGFRPDVAQIDTSYGDNLSELRKIEATVDSVRTLGQDVIVTKVILKGYASPESSYAHNEALARARVAALRDRLQELCHFEEGVILTAYEPEDWEGLRRMVPGSELPHREEILRLIDEPDLDRDVREWKIKSQFPEDYRLMVEEIYPLLRRTDYEIWCEASADHE